MKRGLFLLALAVFGWMRRRSDYVSSDALARAAARDRAKDRDREAHAPAEVTERIKGRWAKAPEFYRPSHRMWRVK
jgi:hypothetical protein